MSERTRTMILASIGVLLFGLLAAWWYSGFSLDFMKFFAATPQVVSSPTPIASSGGLLACSPTTQTVVVNQVATLTATGGSGTYTWFAPQGTANGAAVNGTAGASLTLTYATPGTKKITVQSARSDGSGSVDSAVCTIVVQ